VLSPQVEQDLSRHGPVDEGGEGALIGGIVGHTESFFPVRRGQQPATPSAWLIWTQHGVFPGPN